MKLHSGASSNPQTPTAYNKTIQPLSRCVNVENLRSGQDFISFITSPTALPAASASPLLPLEKSYSHGKPNQDIYKQHRYIKTKFRVTLTWFSEMNNLGFNTINTKSPFVTLIFPNIQRFLQF